MKVRTISGVASSSTTTGNSNVRERTGDIHKVQRNLNQDMHPFERQREYNRALTGTKLERLMAKPFLAAMLGGHGDGVYCLAKNPACLTQLLSGSGDGEIKLWNLSTQKATWSARPYKNSFVRGLTFCPPSSSSSTTKFISVGEKTIHLWDLSKFNNKEEEEDVNMGGSTFIGGGSNSGTVSTLKPSSTGTGSKHMNNSNFNDPLTSFTSNNLFTGVDHHKVERRFATSSSCVEIWDHARSEPTNTFQWGSETITCVKFNPSETSVLASCGGDRSLVLYDIRTSTPISKVILKLKSNALAWNPMEPFNFTVANEDHNCYTFDMRYLNNSLSIAKGHVSAVMDLDYSPTGQEFVTASYDKTLRIFEARSGTSRDIYHTKRMQRAFSVKFSMDGKYILGGSDDGNVRLWKARASEKLGTLSNREMASQQYTNALKDRYKDMTEIAKISRHRRLPRAITKATAKKGVMIQSLKNKEDNRRKHSKPGAVPYVPERKKAILTIDK